jgi:hypothetical protein
MNSLHWNETRPGYYERHHDTREQMILRVVNTSKEAVGAYLTLAVKLDYDDEKLHPDTAIKEAWVMLQYEHPSLASVSNFRLYQGAKVSPAEGHPKGDFVLSAVNEGASIPSHPRVNGRRWRNDAHAQPLQPFNLSKTSPAH